MHGNQMKVLWEEERIETELSCTHMEYKELRSKNKRHGMHGN
jgi:hypothetical protein